MSSALAALTNFTSPNSPSLLRLVRSRRRVADERFAV